MQDDKFRPTSPRRHGRERPSEAEATQTIDFSIFRKKSSEVVTSLTENSISFSKANQPSLTTILGGLNLICQKRQPPADLFKELEIANADKRFLQYLNQKTMLELLRVFRDKVTSFGALAGIISFYPVSVFFLEIYARQFALHYLATTTKLENEMMMGNQFQVLNDYNCSLRGNALDLVVKALRLSVCVKHSKTEHHKFMRKLSLTELEENYGGEDPCAVIEINSNTREMIFTLTEKTQAEASEGKKPKIELLQRKSRIKDAFNPRAPTESRSLYRDKICESCGSKECQCKYLDESEIVSSNNLSKSISGGFAQYQSKGNQLNKLNSLGAGFINVNKIVNRESHRNN